MSDSANKSNGTQFEKLNVRKELGKYLKYWPWFVLCAVISCGFGYTYLRYTTPIYSAKATIIINNGEGNGGAAVVADMGGMTGLGTGNLESELGIMKSRRLMKDVVKSLNLHIQYFQEGKVRRVELYEKIPFTLRVLRLDEESLRNKGSVNYEVSYTGTNFRVTDVKNEKVFTVSPGVPVNFGFADVVLSVNPDFKKKNNSQATTIRFSDIEKVAARYRGKVILTQNDKASGLLEMELRDPVKEKARDILDQLVLEFNRRAIEDKNLIAGNSAKFINDRLAIINEELDSVETGKEDFKERNRLTDIQAESRLYIQNASDYNQRRQEVGTQLELANAILEYLGNSAPSNLLPTNLGLADGGVNQQITEYNNLVLERNRILAGSSEKNPVIIRLNNLINQLKMNIQQSLQRMRSNLQISLEDVERQAMSIGSQITAVPSKERQFRGIERQQNIKETLYLFLLQKREENSLSLAVTEPKAKIVDRAYFSNGAISPNSRSIYLGTFILGLFVPFSVIYIKGVLDDKIRGRQDIEKLGREISILGEIPAVPKNKAIIGLNDRSVLAESFRILITNLQYLLVGAKDKSKGIKLFVTSTIKGEGKTFTAINLAVTLANTNKKVLLLGADLRNPKLQEFKKDQNQDLGITDYLINDKINLRDLINVSRLHPDLYILSSGNIPPNPYELLKQEKFGDIFSQLEFDYDFIIVDTSPTMLVADTFLITNFADLTLYLVRSGHTEKELLEFPKHAHEEGKIHNVSFVLNDVKQGNLAFGNKYGYGYAQEKKNILGRKIALNPH